MRTRLRGKFKAAKLDGRYLEVCVVLAAMASGPGSPVPETGGVGHGKYPKGVTSDMLEPYIFGNKQGLFKLFNAMVCVGM